MTQEDTDRKEEYNRRYTTNSFYSLLECFMLDMFESKAAAQNTVVCMKETGFRWLVEEYAKRKQGYKAKHGVYILNNLQLFSKRIT